METSLLTIAVNKNEEIRLIRKDYRGKFYLDVRKFKGTGDEAQPTTKGFIAEMDVWKKLAPIIGAEISGAE
ncbi:PC4/YdbC family ssDNA-binding protein [Geobacter sp. FeAm09]|uniref:PC4/YdbC family ssDNA-binding protein n=1 Tax=Geobacter sp. FeAm09 TaxID=2597769 RepID=UPI00143D0A58|nr:PC4/YdbC family ssDNA-binding protein [Geobacter sp. FeAm09]